MCYRIDDIGLWLNITTNMQLFKHMLTYMYIQLHAHQFYIGYNMRKHKTYPVILSLSYLLYILYLHILCR